MKINENLLKSISDITRTIYTNPVSEDDVIDMLEELVNELEHKEEKLSDLQYTIDNYYELKRIDPYEEYGVSERDFI